MPIPKAIQKLGMVPSEALSKKIAELEKEGYSVFSGSSFSTVLLDKDLNEIRLNSEGVVIDEDGNPIKESS